MRYGHHSFHHGFRRRGELWCRPTIPPGVSNILAQCEVLEGFWRAKNPFQAPRFKLAFVEDKSRERRSRGERFQLGEVFGQGDAGDVEICKGRVTEQAVKPVKIPKIGAGAMRVNGHCCKM